MVVQEWLLNCLLVSTKVVKVVIDFYVILKFQSIILKYQIDTLEFPKFQIGPLESLKCQIGTLKFPKCKMEIFCYGSVYRRFIVQ